MTKLTQYQKDEVELVLEKLDLDKVQLDEVQTWEDLENETAESMGQSDFDFWLSHIK